MTVEETATFPALHLADVNCHDIWDRRECSITNADHWKSLISDYRATSDFENGIPHMIHQIWIGTRQPPCVWLDTWRVDYMSAFKSKPSCPDWRYYMWDNDAVCDMPMINRHLFDTESAPQCQADILRLEVLYKYGGVYIDADIVSTVRDLRPVLETAKETGFVITYEPDTKDKPYSVLGNSIIAATPGHPLVLMLMAYISQIYRHKRAHYGVEWVTGPLTYTKVLIHTEMPVTIPESKHFYPAFHYIPNPSAIDVTTLDSYCFQFGYTCSGLSQWVAENNRCKHAHECSHHANIEYPLGKLRQFPVEMPPVDPEATVPKVIHQFSFSDNPPSRWSDTWKNVFCPKFGYQYQQWTWNRLREEVGQFFCANLYERNKMDEFSIQMLALEIVNKFGGYYVPLSTIFTGSTDESTASTLFSTDSAVFERGSIFGCAPEAALSKLKSSYDSGTVARPAEALPSEHVSDMSYGDHITTLSAFKQGSRYLGAAEIYHVPEKLSDGDMASSLHAPLIWAYDCQVPIYNVGPKEATLMMNNSGKRAVVITDGMFGAFSSLINELPGVMYKLDEQNTPWDFIVFSMEWEVESEGFDIYQASSAFKAPTARYLGFIANSHAVAWLKSTRIEDILAQHDGGKVYVASEKSCHSAKLASIYRNMGSIDHACRTLANFSPNFDRDCDEVHDNLLKGMRDGQVAFELQVDDQQRVMFRSWANGCIDCECKVQQGVNGLTVEFLRHYEGGVVLHDITGATVR